MNLTELHDILYDIMCAIDDACQKENIPYMLGGGTMLGAIRHQGFIPWDDDADLCIWHGDYPAMRDALKKHLPEHLRLIEPRDFKGKFYDFIPRVQDMRYMWHEPLEEDEYYENMQNFVCVDIFIVGYSANTIFGQKIRALQLKALYGMAMKYRFLIKAKKYSLSQKLQVYILQILGQLTTMEKILKRYEDLCCEMNAQKKKYCIVLNDLPRYIGILYESTWFLGTVNKVFEGREFPVQSGYHQKMTLQYGDYMQPPKNKEEFVKHLEN